MGHSYRYTGRYSELDPTTVAARYGRIKPLLVRSSTWICVTLLLLCSALSTCAQQSGTAATNSLVPLLVNFSGTASDLNGKPLTGVVGVTFYLYKDSEGGAPLWMETQNVRSSSTGRYSVMLGSSSSTGLPADLFSSGEARWLGVQVQGQAEQPRTLLLSVPYALKALDAETIHGMPLSAFVLAAPANASPANTTPGTAVSGPVAAPNAALNVTTTGGTVSTIPMFTTSTNVQNSLLTQTATTAVNVKGILNLPATGTATAAGGKNSQGLNLVASSFSSTSSTAQNQVFRWQAEPAANNTTAPSGTLNLLYGLGTATPTETGLKLSSKGVFTFAPGQTFSGGPFCIATAGGFGSGGTTFVAPGFTVPAENKCTPWSGFTKTASTVILTTSGGACLSSTGKTLTVSVASADPDFLGTNPASDYIQLTRSSSTGSFTGGTDQGQFAGSADQVTCTSGLLSLPDIHD